MTDPFDVRLSPGRSVAVAPGRDLFRDARTSSTVLRASRHEPLGCVVLSVWRGDRCVATFHLSEADVDRLVGVLDPGPSAQTAVVESLP